MNGSVFDHSQPNVMWPDPIVVDSNMVVANFQHFYPGQDHRRVERARAFFQRLLHDGQQGVLTPTAFSAVVHVAVRKTYEQLVRGHRAELRRRYDAQVDGWRDVYKQDPVPLQQLAHDLNELRESLVPYNLAIADLNDLGGSVIPDSRHSSEELIERMTRYGLDSSDAMITIEASRLGIGAIVSMDRDMRRAVPDFDIYT